MFGGGPEVEPPTGDTPDLPSKWEGDLCCELGVDGLDHECGPGKLLETEVGELLLSPVSYKLELRRVKALERIADALEHQATRP